MKKVVIVGGGISGMTAGILLQQAGIPTEIYEKNPLPGGQCTGWKREGYMIDNCVHWLTGTRSGSGLYDLWNAVGVLGPEMELRRKPMFFSAELNGQKLTFWRDKEKTRQEMLALSPEDAKEIHKLMDYVTLAETMSVPVEKPFDAMNLLDYMKLGMSMKSMGKVMKEYGRMDIQELADRFHHPLIRKAISSYMPAGYQAYAFLVSYGTVTGENGDIPAGGSLKMALRMADKYKALGGVLHLHTPVQKVLLRDHKAEGVLLSDGSRAEAEEVICACDTSFTFGNLLDASLMPASLKKMYDERKKYPVSSGFQVAFAVDGVFPELSGTHIFYCDPFTVGAQKVDGMSMQTYDYEPDFAPEGHMIIQSNFIQNEESYRYWEQLYSNQETYQAKKQELAEKAMEQLCKAYPVLQGKIRILDIWTPMTYRRWCNSYSGAYMSFVVTKGAKETRVPGVIKGIPNLYIASQWLMGPGGLPTAAGMGKFAAWRIAKKYGKKLDC